VAPPPGAGPPSTAAEAETAEATHAEQVGEDVPEAGEDVLDAGVGEPLVAGVGEAGVAVLVVELALLGVAEDLVGLRRVLELTFGVRVVGIPVRMELQRRLAIGLLDVAVGGALLQAQDLVVVALVGHRRRLPFLGPSGAETRRPGAVTDPRSRI